MIHPITMFRQGFINGANLQSDGTQSFNPEIKLLQRENISIIIATKRFGKGDEFSTTPTQPVFQIFTLSRCFHFTLTFHIFP